jgi:hypothetical protein
MGAFEPCLAGGFTPLGTAMSVGESRVADRVVRFDSAGKRLLQNNSFVNTG